MGYLRLPRWSETFSFNKQVLGCNEKGRIWTERCNRTGLLSSQPELGWYHCSLQEETINLGLKIKSFIQQTQPWVMQALSYSKEAAADLRGPQSLKSPVGTPNSADGKNHWRGFWKAGFPALSSGHSDFRVCGKPQEYIFCTVSMEESQWKAT
jgi:hypothetical protein